MPPSLTQIKRASRIWSEMKVEGEKIRGSFSPRKVNVVEMMEDKFREIIAQGLDLEGQIARKKSPDV